jgi:hypothetical protein
LRWENPASWNKSRNYVLVIAQEALHFDYV